MSVTIRPPPGYFESLIPLTQQTKKGITVLVASLTQTNRQKLTHSGGKAYVCSVTDPGGISQYQHALLLMEIYSSIQVDDKWPKTLRNKSLSSFWENTKPTEVFAEGIRM